MARVRENASDFQLHIFPITMSSKKQKPKKISQSFPIKDGDQLKDQLEMQKTRRNVINDSEPLQIISANNSKVKIPSSAANAHLYYTLLGLKFDSSRYYCGFNTTLLPPAWVETNGCIRTKAHEPFIRLSDWPFGEATILLGNFTKHQHFLVLKGRDLNLLHRLRFHEKPVIANLGWFFRSEIGKSRRHRERELVANFSARPRPPTANIIRL